MTDEHRFTAAELEELAGLLAPRIAALMPPHVCQFDAVDVTELRRIAGVTRGARATALATFVGTAVLAVLTLIGAGVIAWVKGKTAQ